jgi:hypothetical protein
MRWQVYSCSSHTWRWSTITSRALEPYPLGVDSLNSTLIMGAMHLGLESAHLLLVEIENVVVWLKVRWLRLE